MNNCNVQIIAKLNKCKYLEEKDALMFKAKILPPLVKLFLYKLLIIFQYLQKYYLPVNNYHVAQHSHFIILSVQHRCPNWKKVIPSSGDYITICYKIALISIQIKIIIMYGIPVY